MLSTESVSMFLTFILIGLVALDILMTFFLYLPMRLKMDSVERDTREEKEQMTQVVAAIYKLNDRLMVVERLLSASAHNFSPDSDH